MSRSKKLKLVARYENMLKLRQLSRMLECRQQQQNQQQLTHQLEDYLADYANLNSRKDTTLSPVVLRNGSRFVRDLEQALSLQKNRQQVSDDKYRHERDNWLSLHNRSTVIDGLIEQAEHEERLEEITREDRAADEQWTTAFSRKH